MFNKKPRKSPETPQDCSDNQPEYAQIPLKMQQGF